MTVDSADVRSNVIPEQAIDFSVVYITSNDLDRIQVTLPALVGLTDWTTGALISVDNGSDGDVRAFIRELLLRVPLHKIIQNRQNMGVYRAWNQGMRIAEGRYIILFDDDMLVRPGWERELLMILSVPEIGSAALLTDEMEFTEYVQKAIRVQCPSDLTALSVDGNVAGVIGFRREVFEKLGYACEQYGLYGEGDCDWGHRILTLGLKNVYTSRPFVTHLRDAFPAQKWREVNRTLRDQRIASFSADDPPSIYEPFHADVAGE